ncbi:hypothetical protein ACW9UR_12080 [Halovulum sp. GXIMD14794]
MTVQTGYGPVIHQIVGPYSQWPRRRPAVSPRRVGILVGTAGIGAAFAHCVLPLIV